MAAQDELTLLDRVFLRIGSAETDEQLQNAVSKFLPPVLLKLSSQQEGVRKKVMELLVHINKRIKSRPLIQLPLEALLLQYQDPAATSFVTNFTIIYIKLGYPRMEVTKQAELMPCLLNSLEGKPQAQQDSLLLMLMPILGHVKVPSDPEKRKTLFSLSEKPKISSLLLDFMLDMLLLPYGLTSQIMSKSVPSIQTISPSGSSSGTSVGSSAPPGLSDYSFKRVTAENALNPEQLEEAKLGIVKFLSSGVFPDADIVIHLIIASSDTRHSVANAADLELKKTACNTSLNNPAVVSKLYSIFLGPVPLKDQVPVKPEHKKTPANTRIRLKIFAHLLKSREATLQFPACIQVIFDCLYGTNTNAKLKVMAVQFVHHICENCNEARLMPIGPVLLSGMVKLIAETKDDSKLRSLAFVAVGKLSHKLQHLVSKDMALVQTFFDAMSQEDQNTRLAVQEALSLMLPAFTHLDSANKIVMEALLLSNVEKSEPQVRLLAVQYAANIFPKDNIPSRYVLLLAAGDVREDVRATASKYLRHSSSVVKPEDGVKNLLYPPFPELISFINEKASQRMKSNQKYSTASTSLPFNPSTIAEMIVYLRMSLAQSAGLVPSHDAMKEQAPMIAPYVRNLLTAQSGDQGPIQAYIQLIKNLLSAIGSPPAMYCLLEIVAIVPDILSHYFVKNVEWITKIMYSTKEEMREYAAELYVIILSHASNDKNFIESVKDLTKAVNDKSLETQHGAILALGHAIGRKLRMNGQQTEMDITLIESTSILIDMVKNSHPLLSSASCTALGEIGRHGMLPLKADTCLSTVVNDLMTIVKSSKPENKMVREKAASAVGFLCLHGVDDETSLFVLNSLLQSASEMKDIEVQYTIGESLVNATLGRLSPIAKDSWVIREDNITMLPGSEPAHLAWLVDEILTKHSSSLNPNVRQASCIWMLAILNKCHTFPSIGSRMEKIQHFFIRMLTENNDLTQDMAAKGLGIVYEFSAEELRSKLVNMLLETLTSGKKPAQKVSDETQIFEEGAIPNPLGGNLTTYKELCSFATDLNQPDLVYRFMHLARHDAAWNSKKGAAFGFGMIASKAGEQLTPHLPKIVPRLYRYQFDPNLKIQQSMTSIWHALVPEPQKTIDKYLKEIIQEIATNLTNNLWRVRESCCLALADVLRGRQLDPIIADLPGLWETCFRVRDDIKESVRLAADSSLKALSRVSVKLCDANTGKSSSEAVGVFLPVLLKSGFGSVVPEVRTISLSTVVKMSKQAGPLLKPHLSVLLVALLESLSALESSAVNYHSVRFSNEESLQESFDFIRIGVSKASPMMETINYCIQYVDSGVLEELIPRLVELIRHSVGLGTKAGCAIFLTSLTAQCQRELQPHAGKLLGALVGGLNDRNAAVRKHYATAIGHLVKTAKSSSVEKLIGKVQLWYMEKEEDTLRDSCGNTLQAIAQHSPDVLREHAAQVLPLAFLATHSSKQKENSSMSDLKSSVWEDVWLEGTPGTESGIRLYLDEIVTLSRSALESQSWSMKAQAALAMKTVAAKLGSTLGPPHLGLLMRALIDGLAGRTWTGKDSLLSALESICVNCKTTILNETSEQNEQQPSITEVIDTVLRESHKEKIAYKEKALHCLGSILNAYEEDRFSSVLEIVRPILSKDLNGNRAGLESDDIDAKDREKLQHLLETAFEAIGLAWPKNKDTQIQYQEQICQLLVSSVNSNVWKVQLVIIKSLGKFVDRLQLFEVDELSADDERILQSILEKLLQPLCFCIGVAKYGTLRSEALRVIESILTKLKDKNRLRLMDDKGRNDLRGALGVLSQDSMPDLQIKAGELRKIVANE